MWDGSVDHQLIIPAFLVKFKINLVSEFLDIRIFHFLMNEIAFDETTQMGYVIHARKYNGELSGNESLKNIHDAYMRTKALYSLDKPDFENIANTFKTFANER